MAELKNPIQEAERYLRNAQQLLSEKVAQSGITGKRNDCLGRQALQIC